jgi:VanZ family protein
MQNLLVHKYSFYFAVILTIGITMGSLLSPKDNQITPVLISDKLVHIVAYLLLTFFWILTYNYRSRISFLNVSIALVVGIYGIIIEVLQGSIAANRQFDFYDIYANLIGICIGALLFSIIFRKKPVN